MYVCMYVCMYIVLKIEKNYTFIPCMYVCTTITDWNGERRFQARNFDLRLTSDVESWKKKNILRVK